jgi:hypothetical protein
MGKTEKENREGGVMKQPITITVNWDDIKSIRRAEKLKSKYENKGYSVYYTFPTGFNKFRLKLKKVI